MASHFIIECLDCGHRTPFLASASDCPNCHSTWREAIYDYNRLSKSLLLQVSGRPFDLWRYRELLPVRSIEPSLAMGEGGTPLLRASNLGGMLGCPNIFIKDERQGPTGSFKDRQAAVTIATLKESGINELVVASTGNVAIAYSAYAARAGIRLWAFLTSMVPAEKMREVALYGTQVIKVTGSYDEAKQVAADFARQRGIFYDLGTRTISCVESMKTVSYEVTEQLTSLLGPPPNSDSSKPGIPFFSPDWYIQSVSGGLGPVGVHKGFQEFKKMGFIDKIPKIAAIQSEGCAPMVQAWKQNQEVAIPIQKPSTMISTLATGDPGRTYTVLRQKMLNTSGGTFESVPDEEAFKAMHYLAKMEGISVEPATAVAFAGMIKLIRAGTIKPDEVVVINCSGHTMPIEQRIIGEGWLKDVKVGSRDNEVNSEEGLLSALTMSSIDGFPRIAIVDDEPDARRLIRRILQTQGNYTLFEATNGKEAIELVNKEHPDLIILDLMMPELDGFSVMDALQKKPETAEIPIIVVTAKELTLNEKSRLQGHIQGLMQKGDFLNDGLLDEVKSLLR
jgi:threonine synthase